MSHDTFEYELEIQYRDLDPRSHVNHARYVSYLEQAKADFFREVLDTSLTEPNTAIRHVELDYEAPIEFDRSVVVSLGPIETGTTSYTVEYDVVDGDTTVASATTVSVLLDDRDQPRPLPDAWRDAIAPYEP